mmetsp:Transcript_95234/g.275260  ORF Transcript_95234/g.275260 Transcript_95234/m.275260 type:complete len:271 (-) Transcript_95234:3874-4686(-)
MRDVQPGWQIPDRRGRGRPLGAVGHLRAHGCLGRRGGQSDRRHRLLAQRPIHGGRRCAGPRHGLASPRRSRADRQRAHGRPGANHGYGRPWGRRTPRRGHHSHGGRVDLHARLGSDRRIQARRAHQRRVLFAGWDHVGRGGRHGRHVRPHDEEGGLAQHADGHLERIGCGLGVQLHGLHPLRRHRAHHGLRAHGEAAGGVGRDLDHRHLARRPGVPENLRAPQRRGRSLPRLVARLDVSGLRRRGDAGARVGRRRRAPRVSAAEADGLVV